MHRTQFKIVIVLLSILLSCQSPTEVGNYNSDYDIVFGRDYDIFIMKNADSTRIIQLTNEKSDIGPKWSPDGTKIAFDASGRGSGLGLYCMNSDGTNIIRLVSLGSYFMADWEWSPDGSKIAFSHDFGEGRRCVYTVNADGTGLKRLSSGPFDLGITWSPDGSQIAYSKRDENSCHAYIINADGSNEHQFIDAVISGQARWSPDGRQIVFSARFNLTNEKNKFCTDIYLADCQGKNLQRLTNYEITNLTSGYPRWSPNGTKIFFFRRVVDDSENCGIYVIDLKDRTILKLISMDGIGRFHLSPDGEQILIERWRSSDARYPDSFDFYLMNSDGTNLKKILSKANSPDWCPVLR